MNEHERKNLEELLSSYIDGELSERQCNEVKRLIGHNEQAAAMLKEMQKYKALLGSLPQAQAPAHLFENVRASLERSVLLDEYHGKAKCKGRGCAFIYTQNDGSGGNDRPCGGAWFCDLSHRKAGIRAAG